MVSKTRNRGFQNICTHLTLGVCPCAPPTHPSSSSSTKKRICKEAHTNARRGKQPKNQEEEEEEQERNPSTLMLFYDYQYWKIKKVLTDSDLGNLSRFMLAKEQVESFVMPMLGPEAQIEANSKKGTQIMIWDVDTNSMHELTFRLWTSSQSYIFNRTWTRYFVKRRGLQKGDEVGFQWDPRKNCFDFSVLHRA